MPRGNEREKPQDPVRTSLQDAKAYLEWLSRKTGESISLPTAAQLQQAVEMGAIHLSVPEWTSEGFIFDPNTKNLDTDPKEGTIASFRLVKNTPPPDKS